MCTRYLRIDWTVIVHATPVEYNSPIFHLRSGTNLALDVDNGVLRVYHHPQLTKSSMPSPTTRTIVSLNLKQTTGVFKINRG